VNDSFVIRRLDAREVLEKIVALSAILIDCVQGGASVGFMQPMNHEKASAFWRMVAAGVDRGERTLLVATNERNDVVGTVQFVNAGPENQPHRADVVKMLVHSNARRHGVAGLLMRALEDEARAAGRTVLVLDTVTGSAAEHLYLRAGWQRVGDIPEYALMPDGPRCSTTFFFKKLD
jgi:GNAT superfamily N-acetyltransferase